MDLEKSESCTPSSIIEEANLASNKILPERSREIYEFVYKKFMDWRIDNNIKSFSENVVLAYIGKISKDLNPSTLWSTYSMLRNTINIKHNVDIANYPKLKAFLKRQSTGNQCKKAKKVLTSEQIQKFINDAPDDRFLFTKVALIFGIAGACRSHELKDLEINNVQDLEKALLVTIPNTKINIQRSFTIVDNYYKICKKYIKLRPSGINNTTPRFFLNYQKGRCTKQVIGINKFGNVPKQIAEFLNLPDPQLYTGQSLRRSSTTALTEIKQHGGWKSSTVAEQYPTENLPIIPENFPSNLPDVTELLPNMPIATSTSSSTEVSTEVGNQNNNPFINIYNNCVFNIYSNRK